MKPLGRPNSKGFKSCPRVGGIINVLQIVHKALGFKSCPRVGGIRRPLPPLLME